MMTLFTTMAAPKTKNIVFLNHKMQLIPTSIILGQHVLLTRDPFKVYLRIQQISQINPVESVIKTLWQVHVQLSPLQSISVSNPLSDMGWAFYDNRLISKTYHGLKFTHILLLLGIVNKHSKTGSTDQTILVSIQIAAPSFCILFHNQ